MFTVEVPTSIPVSGKSDFILNLNHYRNAHHHVLNKAKVNFTALMLGRLKPLPRMQQVNLTYTHFSGDNTLSDTSNVCSIVDKFFSDALVDAGRIQDDNYTFVKDVLYRHGGVDKGKPRVEVTITPIGEYVFSEPEQEEADMLITLEQAEIEQAITDYIHGQLNVKDGMQIEIALSATRGAAGFTATINIVPVETPVTGAVITLAQADRRQPEVTKTRTVTATKEELVKTATVVAEKAAVEVVTEPQAEVVVDTADVAAEAEAADLQVEEAQEAEPEVETPPVTKPATSLFAGLQRPKNS